MRRSFRKANVVLSIGLIATTACASGLLNGAAPAMPRYLISNVQQDTTQSTQAGLAPGVYTEKNVDGGTQTLYSTGDTQPYHVDNPNTNNAQVPVIVQPIINMPVMPPSGRIKE